MDLQTILSMLMSNGGITVQIVVLSIVIYSLGQFLQIFFNRLKRKLETHHNIKGSTKRINIDKSMQSLLDLTILRIDCIRISVIEFHNSNKNIAFVPFDYMTCMYEIYLPGLSPMAQLCKSVPTSLYHSLFNCLRRDPLLIIDVDDQQENIQRAVYDMIIARGAKKSLYVPILSTFNRLPIGCIAIDFDKSAPIPASVYETAKEIAHTAGYVINIEEL